jgi:hypothetical protein
MVGGAPWSIPAADERASADELRSHIARHPGIATHIRSFQPIEHRPCRRGTTLCTVQVAQ